MYMYNEAISQLRLYRGYTLVDITKTNVVRADPANPLPRNQQRNWETLIQVLGLRTQLTMLGSPELLIADAAVFDPKYHGTQRIWTFKFGVEYDDIFSDGKTPFGNLASDFANVPVITGLTETVTFGISTFDAINVKNIHFEEIEF